MGGGGRVEWVTSGLDGADMTDKRGSDAVKGCD